MERAKTKLERCIVVCTRGCRCEKSIGLYMLGATTFSEHSLSHTFTLNGLVKKAEFGMQSKHIDKKGEKK